MPPELTAFTDMIAVGDKNRRIRVARWPGSNRSPKAVVLLFLGLSEFIEKYEEVARDLVGRDLLVLSLDWGGQGLSDRPLENRHKIHTITYDDRLDEIDALLAWSNEQVGDLPIVVLGHSMGGHIALRFVSDRPPSRLSAVALSAPMVGIGGLPGKIGPWAAPLAVMAGYAESYLPGRGDYDASNEEDLAGRLSSDEERDAWQRELYVANPDLVVGGATWGWLNASLKSVARLKQMGVLENITCPSMLAIAGQEVLVDNTAIRSAAARMPRARLVEYENAKHEILMEIDDIRNRFLDDFDALLNQAGLSR